MNKYPFKTVLPRYSVNQFVVGIVAFLFLGTFPTLVGATGGHHASKSFSASAGFTIGDFCFASANDDLQDVIEYMADEGYSISSGHFELYDEETSNLYIPFADDNTDYLIARFDNSNNSEIRFGGRDVFLFQVCTFSANWYFAFGSHNVTRIINQDAGGNVTDAKLLQASLGDPFNPANYNTHNGPSDPYTGESWIAVTGDQVSWNDLQAAFMAAGLGDEPFNLEVIPADFFTFSENNETLPRDTIGYIMRLIQTRMPHPDGLVIDKEHLFDRPIPAYLFQMSEAEPRIHLLQELQDPTPPFFQVLIKHAIKGPFLRLVRKVRNHFTDQGYTFVSNTPLVPEGATVEGVPVHIFDHGEFCIDNEKDCTFDKRDSLYWWDQEAHLLAGDDFYLLVGVDHTKIGMAELSTRGVFSVTDQDSGRTFVQKVALTNNEVEPFPISNVLNISNPLLRAVARQSFLVQLSRPQNCVGGIAPFCLDTDILESDEHFVITGELTWNPQTGTRPDEDQVIPWRLLHFKIPPTP